MPQGISAVRLTNGLYLLPLTLRYGRGVGFVGGRDSETSYMFGLGDGECPEKILLM